MPRSRPLSKSELTDAVELGTSVNKSGVGAPELPDPPRPGYGSLLATRHKTLRLAGLVEGATGEGATALSGGQTEAALRSARSACAAVAEESATALSVAEAGAASRYTRWAAHTVPAPLSLCTAGEASASATDLHVGAARTIDASVSCLATAEVSP